MFCQFGILVVMGAEITALGIPLEITLLMIQDPRSQNPKAALTSCLPYLLAALLSEVLFLGRLSPPWKNRTQNNLLQNHGLFFPALWTLLCASPLKLWSK